MPRLFPTQHTVERITDGKKIVEKWVERENVCSLVERKVTETIFGRETTTTLSNIWDGISVRQETSRFGVPVITYGRTFEESFVDSLVTGKDDVFEKLTKLSLDTPKERLIGNPEGKHLLITQNRRYKCFSENYYIATRKGRFDEIHYKDLHMSVDAGQTLGELPGTDQRVVQKFIREQADLASGKAAEVATEAADAVQGTVTSAAKSASKWKTAGKWALIGLAVTGALYGMYKLGQYVANKKNAKQDGNI